MRTYLSILTAVFLLFSSCTNKYPDNKFGDTFIIQSGINLSCWFSQENWDVESGEVPRIEYLNYTDLKLLDSLGFDHVRFNIDETRLFDTANFDTEENIKLFLNSIDTCYDLGLRVVVELHLARYHAFRANHDFWDDSTNYKKLTHTWKQLHQLLKDYPENFLAYEILNEPVPDSAVQWNNVLAKVIPEIRKWAPTRKLIVGPERWNNIESLKTLKLPENDTNIIVTFHFYEPYVLTHYKANWAVHYVYDGPIQYPGKIVEKEWLANEPDSVKNFINENLTYMDIDSMDNMVKRAVEYAQSRNMGIYCGEFGCKKTVPRDLRLQWYRDLIKTFRKYDIPYTHWDYKCRNEFGIRTEEGENDYELIDILVNQ